MTADNWWSLVAGCAIGAAITAGVVVFDSSKNDHEPACQNEVFTICINRVDSSGVFGQKTVAYKSGKAECYAYPTKKYEVKNIYAPFLGKSVTNRSNPTETILYRHQDYLRADFVCTDTVNVIPNRK